LNSANQSIDAIYLTFDALIFDNCSTTYRNLAEGALCPILHSKVQMIGNAQVAKVMSTSCADWFTKHLQAEIKVKIKMKLFVSNACEENNHNLTASTIST